MMMNTCNPRIQEAEAREPGVLSPKLYPVANKNDNLLTKLHCHHYTQPLSWLFKERGGRRGGKEGRRKEKKEGGYKAVGKYI